MLNIPKDPIQKKNKAINIAVFLLVIFALGTFSWVIEDMTFFQNSYRAQAQVEGYNGRGGSKACRVFYSFIDANSNKVSGKSECYGLIGQPQNIEIQYATEKPTLNRVYRPYTFASLFFPLSLLGIFLLLKNKERI